MTDGERGLAALGPVAPIEIVDSTLGLDPAAIGHRVKAARTRISMTGEELGAMVGLKKDQISKVEAGRRRVSARELPALAEALGVPVSELLGRKSHPQLAMANRLVVGHGSGPQSGSRRRALQLLEIEDALNRAVVTTPPEMSGPGVRVRAYSTDKFASRPRNQAEAQRQGRLLAEEVRLQLKLGSNEIGDLAGLMELNFGVDVAVSPLGTEVDGLCVHGDGIALIVVSSDFSDGHVRFTLAHELGHHLLGDPRSIIDEHEQDMLADDLIERRVNAFAGHLLMPEGGVRQMQHWISPGAVNERLLVALMEHFGVSFAALVRQLVVLRLISPEIGVRLRECQVVALVHRHRDVAPRGAATGIHRMVRAPERLLKTALSAARAELMGLSVVAALLERDDDDRLWQDLMDEQVIAESIEVEQVR